MPWRIHGCETGWRAHRSAVRYRKARSEGGGSRVYSLRNSASAESVAHGNRTARSSPSRHSWLSQPRAPRRTGQSDIRGGGHAADLEPTPQ